MAKKRDKSIAIKVVELILAAFIAKGLGFVREMVLANYYGTSYVSDVFVAVQNIPAIIFTVFGTAVTTGFIPLYTEIKVKKNKELADRFANNVFNIFCLLFDENTVLFVSRALKIYALGIVGASFRDVLNKVLYSMKDTKTPMINGTIAVAVNIGLNVVLVRRFEYLGLAVATSISATVCTILLLIQMCKKLDGFQSREAIRTFIKAFLAMSFMCAAVSTIMPRIDKLQDITRCIIGGTIGCVIYIVVLLLLKEKLIVQAVSKVNNRVEK